MVKCDVMFKYAVRDLLGLLAFVAVALTALKYSSQTWWSIVAAAAWLSLAVAATLMIVDRGAVQAAAVGFFVFFVVFRVTVLLPVETSPEAILFLPARNVLNPSGAQFMFIWHHLWAIGLGLVGCRFASFVYS